MATPTLSRPDTSEARWWFGSLAGIRLTAADTGGALTVVEVLDPPDSWAPLHVHHTADETFVLMEGSATFEVGGEAIEARAGDVVFGPRGVPHRYTTGPSGCRMVFVLTPGGFEDLVRETSVPAGARALPPPGVGLPDMGTLPAVAARHGCAVLEG